MIISKFSSLKTFLKYTKFNRLFTNYSPLSSISRTPPTYTMDHHFSRYEVFPITDRVINGLNCHNFRTFFFKDFFQLRLDMIKQLNLTITDPENEYNEVFLYFWDELDHARSEYSSVLNDIINYINFDGNIDDKVLLYKKYKLIDFLVIDINELKKKSDEERIKLMSKIFQSLYFSIQDFKNKGLNLNSIDGSVYASISISRYGLVQFVSEEGVFKLKPNIFL